MQSAPQELLKQYVQIQQVMEVEETLGRERCQRTAVENTSRNYRNGYSQKTVKT